MIGGRRKAAEAEAAVTLLYRAVLRREPDAEGLAAQAAWLRRRGTLAGLVEALTTSPEFADSVLIPRAEAGRRDRYDVAHDPRLAVLWEPDVAALSRELATGAEPDSTRLAEAVAVAQARWRALARESRWADLAPPMDRARSETLARIVAGLLRREDWPTPRLRHLGLGPDALLLRALFPHAVLTVADRADVPPPPEGDIAMLHVDLAGQGGEATAPGDSAEVIVAMDVLERLTDGPAQTLRGLLGGLAAGGLLVLGARNAFRREALAAVAERRNSAPVWPTAWGPQDAPAFLFRDYAMGELLALAREAGGEVTAAFFAPGDEDMSPGPWAGEGWTAPGEPEPAERPPEELARLWVVMRRAPAEAGWAPAPARDG